MKKRKSLFCFGSILPPGEKRSDNEIPYFQFTEEQMKQISLVGKPLKDEHGDFGRTDDMGKIIFSHLGDDGRMYIIGEVTDEVIIDEILSGKKLGLSMNHDYHLFPLPGKGWVDYKKITEVSVTTVPNHHREGHSILSFFYSNGENFSDNLSDEIISSQDNLHRKKSKENLEEKLENLEMSSASSEPTSTETTTPQSSESDVKKTSGPLSPEQARSMLEAVTKFKKQTEDAEEEREKYKQEIEQLKAQFEETKKQNEEFKAIDDKRTLEQSNKLVQAFGNFVKLLGPDVTPQSTLTEEDLPKPGEVWTSEKYGKFTDSFVSAAACAERRLDTLQTANNQFEDLKDVIISGNPTKRKRFQEPSKPEIEKSKTQAARDAEYKKVQEIAEMAMTKL